MTGPAGQRTVERAATTSADTVRRFLQALADGDVDTVLALVDDDIVYENVSLPTIRGRRRFERVVALLNRPHVGFDVRIHRIADNGGTVLTERTDALLVGGYRSQFWVCGVFEVVEGRITLWRDYFDWRAVLAASLRGLAGLAVPALRARWDAEAAHATA